MIRSTRSMGGSWIRDAGRTFCVQTLLRGHDGLRPAAAIGRSRKETLPRLLDHVVCAQQQRLRDRESERYRGLEVDHELELGGLFDWQITGFCALENLVHVAGGAPK